GRLPAAQREAFILREEAGMSLEAIGVCAGVGRETIKSRLRYAVKTLRVALEDCL
ncbi:MAG: RNA polymerase subunit sigma, partial [Chromatiaceae bacterium]|nr:RNA polymerase subunit sigma [Chromatiaceae bacterium]